MEISSIKGDIKMKKAVVIIGMCFMLFSCANQINEIHDSRKPVQKTIKVQRMAVDSGNYVDVTMKNVNASVIDTNYFDSVIKNNYKSDNCTINFDKSKNMVSVYVNNSKMKGFEGKTIRCTYKYVLKSSSENCVYICPVKRSDTLCFIDEEPYSLSKLPSFMFYIPLYGFGENRIEVSSIMKNEGAVNCQTLWRY